MTLLQFYNHFYNNIHVYKITFWYKALNHFNFMFHVFSFRLSVDWEPLWGEALQMDKGMCFCSNIISVLGIFYMAVVCNAFYHFKGLIYI